MGCCFSWCKDGTNADEVEDSERRSLIDESANTSIQTNLPVENSEPYNSSFSKKNDEQSDLHRILQNTLTKVIDISALGCNNLDHSEYLERMNMYKSKLNVAPLPHVIRHQECILVDVPIVCTSPCDTSDFILMWDAAEKADTAFQDVKVEHTNDLVVPFLIPQ